MKNIPLNILVADDNPQILESVQEILYNLSKRFKDEINIFTALSGIECIKIVENIRVDAVFLDYHFESGINGAEIFENIPDPFKSIIFVLMSARAQNELENIIIKNRFSLGTRFKFLRKPFDEIELQDRYLEIIEIIRSRPLPFPLAHSMTTLESVSTFQAQMTAIKDFLETFLRLSVSILTSDAERLGILPKRFQSFSITQNLTFGAWASWLSEILNTFEENASFDFFMPELVEMIRNRRLLTLLFKFKTEIRDPEIGHGFLREEDSYANLTKEYMAETKSLYSALQFTSNYQLVARESVEFSDQTNQYNYKVKLLMGPDLKPSQVEFQSVYRLLKSVYFVDSRGRILDLGPFFVYIHCTQCSFSHLFLLEKINPKDLLYVGHCNYRKTLSKGEELGKKYHEVFDDIYLH